MLRRLLRLSPLEASGCRGPAACGCPSGTWGYPSKEEQARALEEYQRDLEEESARVAQRIKELKE